MPIKTDYVEGEGYAATDHNDENQQILDNIADDTDFGTSWNDDTDTSPSKNAVYNALVPTGNFISSALSVDVGTSTAIPAGANKAVINITTDRHTTTDYNEGQITIYSAGCTSATVRGVDNGSMKFVTATWSAPNITTTGDTANTGVYSVYFYKN